MIQESLRELYLVADYCIKYQKDPKLWGSPGCFGYPGAILLFVIVDSIGSYIYRGKVRKHFNVLNHKNYYNLKIDKKSIDTIYKEYRCLLTHNAIIGGNAVLQIGKVSDAVFELKNNIAHINLVPFLNVSKMVVAKFLKNQCNGKFRAILEGVTIQGFKKLI